MLIGWSGNSPKTLNFLNGDDLYDVVSGTSITTIPGNKIYRIQSAGNRWLLLGN